MIVTNRNCSVCFMKKSNMKEIEKKPVPTPSPFVPAKKHKSTGKEYPTIYYY